MAALGAHEREALELLLSAVIPSASGPGAREARAVDYVAARLDREDQELVAALRSELLAVDSSTAAHAALERWSADRSQATWALFRRVRAWAWEGFLCDPRHGGNRGGVGWRRFGVSGPPQPAGFPPDDLLGEARPR